MAIGSSWAVGSWASTPDAWAAGTWADGADVPANTSPETAIVIGTLPFAMTQNVHAASTGTTYDVYYTWTATFTGVISVWGFGSDDLTTFRPTMNVYSPDGTTIFNFMSGYQERPTYFAVTFGQQYWFRFVPNAGDPAPAILHVTIQFFTNTTAPTGSILINDASPGFPMALLSSSTGHPLAYVNDFPGGEAMAGVGPYVLAHDIGAINWKLFNGAYQQIAQIDDDQADVVNSDRAGLFYIGQSAVGTTPGLVKSINATTGAVGAQTWTVATGTSALAPSRSNTILYYADGTSGAAVQRWSLTLDLPLSPDLAAGQPGYLVREIFVLADETILVLYREAAGTGTFVLRYHPGGLLLTTYTTQFFDTIGSDPHLALANDDPLTWWAWFKVAGGLSRFINVNTDTGAIQALFEDYHFTSGNSDEPTTATPTTFFGHSESCTFLITGVAPIVPPTVPSRGRSLYIRRMRQTAHLSNEQLRNFFHFFQLDVETGVGLVTGQGSDPQVMLQWSDDGGHTWSREHWVSAGKIGEFKRRAIWRRLGASRDRTFRVVVSDPVKWAFLAAYLDVTPGES